MVLTAISNLMTKAYLAMAGFRALLDGADGGLIGKDNLKAGDAVPIVKAIVTAIMVIPMIGSIFFFVPGIIQIIQAFKDDRNPDAMSAGGKLILAGIGLLLAGPIISSIMNMVLGG